MACHYCSVYYLTIMCAHCVMSETYISSAISMTSIFTRNRHFRHFFHCQNQMMFVPTANSIGRNNTKEECSEVYSINIELHAFSVANKSVTFRFYSLFSMRFMNFVTKATVFLHFLQFKLIGCDLFNRFLLFGTNIMA